MGPGNYFYDKFGHSAIRVQDKNSGLDIVFNYGIFDFNTPNFYSKFARGKLLYSLGLANFEDFYQYYKSEDRWITEQVLNLNIAQKREVFQLLVENAKPENKDYLYDFTYDNCATKIRDILSLALATDLKYNTEQEEKEKSFRQLIGEKLHSNTWGSLGIDLALGAEIDKKVSKWEYQFLPDYVLEANAEAKVKINLEWQPLVKETKKLYKQQDEKKNTGFFSAVLG